MAFIDKSKEMISYVKGWTDDTASDLEIMLTIAVTRAVKVAPCTAFGLPDILEEGKQIYLLRCETSGVNIINTQDPDDFFYVQITGESNDYQEAREKLDEVIQAVPQDLEGKCEAFLRTAIGSQMEDWKVAYLLQGVLLSSSQLSNVFSHSLTNQWGGKTLQQFLQLE